MQDWPWPSAGAHLAGQDDALVTVRPMLDLVADWRDLLADNLSEAELDRLRRHDRPCGGADWIEHLEGQTGRTLRKRKPGPKPLPPMSP